MIKPLWTKTPVTMTHDEACALLRHNIDIATDEHDVRRALTLCNSEIENRLLKLPKLTALLERQEILEAELAKLADVKTDWILR